MIRSLLHVLERYHATNEINKNKSKKTKNVFPDLVLLFQKSDIDSEKPRGDNEAWRK